MSSGVSRLLLLGVAFILGASLVTLYSLGDVLAGDPFSRQAIFALVGLLVMFLLSRLELTVLLRLAPVIYLICLLTLVAVLFFGEVRSGTRGWFNFGPVSLQPSEIARLGTALFVAWIWGNCDGLRLGPRDVLKLSAAVALPMLLVLRQPDLGVAMTYLPILAAACFLGGLPRRAWVALFLLSLVICGAGWRWGLKDYQKERVLTVLDSERDPYGAGYQVRQSKIAVGSGQRFGHGLGRGTQSRLRFLPEQHTDFIFAVWAEATGFLGSSLLLVGYAALLVGILGVAMATQERAALLLITAIGSGLAFQILLNIGMVLGFLPTTGITLPLFSYGGSSLLSTLSGLGLVLGAWRARLVNR